MSLGEITDTLSLLRKAVKDIEQEVHDAQLYSSSSSSPAPAYTPVPASFNTVSMEGSFLGDPEDFLDESSVMRSISQNLANEDA
jgi:hypothetical protein